jgi:hypothetical protein
MSVFAWSFQQLATFWVAAVACATLLFILGGRLQPRPDKFFWLLPAHSPLQGVWVLSVALFRDRPLQATALVIIPLLTVGITLAWLAARLLRT